MKQKFTFKAIFALLSIVLLITGTAVLSFAGEPPAPKAIEWDLSVDKETLGNTESMIYTRYELPVGYEPIFRRECYEFSLGANVKDGGGFYSVRSYSRYGEIVELYYQESSHIYVTEVGREMLDALVDGTLRCYLYSYPGNTYGSVGISQAEAEGLEAKYDEMLAGNAPSVTVEAKDLKNELLLELTVTDESCAVGHTVGAIYRYEPTGEPIYISYDSLDNFHFDSEGNFSYRWGTVTALSLADDPIADGIEADILAAKESPTEFSYEFDDVYDYTDEGEPDGIYYLDWSVAIFWIVLALFGFALPIASLTMSLIFIIKRHEKYWRITAGIAALWIGAALAITLMVLI